MIQWMKLCLGISELKQNVIRFWSCQIHILIWLVLNMQNSSLCGWKVVDDCLPVREPTHPVRSDEIHKDVSSLVFDSDLHFLVVQPFTFRSITPTWWVWTYENCISYSTVCNINLEWSVVIFVYRKMDKYSVEFHKNLKVYPLHSDIYEPSTEYTRASSHALNASLWKATMSSLDKMGSTSE